MTIPLARFADARPWIRVAIACFGIAATVASAEGEQPDHSRNGRSVVNGLASADRDEPAALPERNNSSDGEDRSPRQREAKPKPKVSKDPPGMIRLLPDKDAWIDKANKRVVMDGTVCLREGQLEMFACTVGTKEHESVVSVDVEAYAIHAALQAVGAQPGSPVQFQPEYKAATGPIIDITCIWTDADGKTRRERAQNWVRDWNTKAPMSENWVFGGSGFWEDEETHDRHYLAEGGYLICLSNFGAAMLDLPVESTDKAQAGLLFEAFTENIPPRGTRVRLVLAPRIDKQPDRAAQPSPRN